jgi:hypothetical protein
MASSTVPLRSNSGGKSERFREGVLQPWGQNKRVRVKVPWRHTLWLWSLWSSGTQRWALCNGRFLAQEAE